MNYGTLIDFGSSECEDHPSLSDYMQEAIENYLCHGLHPGGFLEAVIVNNLYAASIRADHWNKPRLAGIASWIYQNAPHGSFGSNHNMMMWIEDESGRRTKYTDALEKKLMWETLTT